MPDDSSPEFRASQSKHGLKIAFERGLMEQTGLTRNQVRAGLRAFNERIESLKSQATTPNIPAPVSTDLPRLGDEGAKFEPRPFAAQPQNTALANPNQKELPAYPESEGEYVLVLTVSESGGVLTWELIEEC